MRKLLDGLGVSGEAIMRHELQTIGDRLIPDFERLAGKDGGLVAGFEPGESILVKSGEMRAENGLKIDFVTVGMAEKTYRKHVVWGQPRGEAMPALRVNRAQTYEQVRIASCLCEALADYDPYKYRILFRKTTEGLRFAGIEYLVDDDAVEGAKEWRECDLTIGFIVLQAMRDLLPRLGQGGE